MINLDKVHGRDWSHEAPFLDARVISAWFSRCSTAPGLRLACQTLKPGPSADSHHSDQYKPQTQPIIERLMFARAPANNSNGLSSRRANCVQQLGIEEEYLYDGDTVPAVVAASIFGSQGGSLLSLSLLVPTVSLDGDGIACLAALTRLTRLEVPSAPSVVIRDAQRYQCPVALRNFSRRGQC